MAENIVNQLNDWKLDRNQIEEESFDEQYFCLKVPAHILMLLLYRQLSLIIKLKLC